MALPAVDFQSQILPPLEFRIPSTRELLAAEAVRPLAIPMPQEQCDGYVAEPTRRRDCN